MSAEFIHIDQAHDAMADLIKELHQWREIANRLYDAVCHSSVLRQNIEYRCEQCELAVEEYRKAADGDES